MNTLRLRNREVPWILIRKNIRHLYARVKPEGYIQVTAPKHTRLAEAEAFLVQVGDRLLARFDSLSAPSPEVGDAVPVWGIRIPCVAEPGRSQPEMKEGILRLPVDGSGKPDAEALEWFFGHLILQEIPTLLAKRNLPSADGWNLQGITYKTQRMTSRLGSCQTVRRIIKLNTVLGRFDRRYLEAVLLHELCHLRVPDHGPRFYRLLESLVPEYRLLRKELRAMVKTVGR